ncbi:MAG: macrolide ABC transporter ATP-binding protein [Candidatus Colwellbacteria bacterium CG10_big_fil_rev_8_21_14_0_10_41_28]|uniref:Macrolide ABC transporter ATP-binding protein n=1 Tax=Candidatus Colwellbacteria bacterium CG10_big_fil_rev_8_21_14_0_10_41_28 TaxID=1974539 RepID=A0A2H0VHB0_9BACT|nr:MAG: macrolide ABC transporter ATP-binding protein [Candidatus Colwellbacteria bacterium CG10_big_fil_rev_8_21_14_0_10_41_28]
MSKLIKATNLKRVYGSGEVETVALKDASLEIEKGEFVSIMGPSGSGKSTLLHILGMLDRQTEGTYEFDGKTIDEYDETQLANLRNESLGFVFQTFNLLPRTTVLENVQLPLIYSDVKESEWSDMAVKAIKAVNLEHRLEHETGQLSGGERQRVAIARALVNDPDVIFADEPTGNLDTKAGIDLMSIITDLNKEGKTIVIVTHEEEIAAYSRRMIKLRDGLIEEDKKISK